VAEDTCIQCRRTPREISDALGRDDVALDATLLTRPRPLLKSSEYQICLQCAQWVQETQEKRLADALAQAERSGV